MQNTNDCINLGHFGPFSGVFVWVVHAPGRVSVFGSRGHVARAAFRSFEISGVSCRVRSPCCMSPAFGGVDAASRFRSRSPAGFRAVSVSRSFRPGLSSPGRVRSVPGTFGPFRGRPVFRGAFMAGAVRAFRFSRRRPNMPTVARFRPFGAISAYFRISGRISARGEICHISGPFTGVRSGARFNC